MQTILFLDDSEIDVRDLRVIMEELNTNEYHIEVVDIEGNKIYMEKIKN